jgi:adenine/guanine phosphoribosyltransferase-like PRPP-binding protein
MKYITIADLSETIRKNIWKIPRDIDFIIGVPRSGMIAASMIASYLNVPLIDVNSFIAGLEPYGGDRLNYFSRSH